MSGSIFECKSNNQFFYSQTFVWIAAQGNHKYQYCNVDNYLIIVNINISEMIHETSFD